MREVESINIREVRRQGHAKEWTFTTELLRKYTN
jgi:hypothetical protein